jgi:hypothetical protein
MEEAFEEGQDPHRTVKPVMMMMMMMMVGTGEVVGLRDGHPGFKSQSGRLDSSVHDSVQNGFTAREPAQY